MKYRTKPIEVEAVQWHPGMKLPGVLETEEVGKFRPRKLGRVQTKNGPIFAHPGDWIVTGTDGEKRVCNPSLFDKLYEKAEAEKE